MGPRGWSLVKDDTKAAGYGDSNTAAGTRGTGAEGLGPLIGADSQTASSTLTQRKWSHVAVKVSRYAHQVHGQSSTPTMNEICPIFGRRSTIQQCLVIIHKLSALIDKNCINNIHLISVLCYLFYFSELFALISLCIPC